MSPKRSNASSLLSSWEADHAIAQAPEEGMTAEPKLEPLKNCPCCGSDDLLRGTGTLPNKPPQPAVKCRACGIGGKLAAWNTRTAPDAEAARRKAIEQAEHEILEWLAFFVGEGGSPTREHDIHITGLILDSVRALSPA